MKSRTKSLHARLPQVPRRGGAFGDTNAGPPGHNWHLIRGGGLARRVVPAPAARCCPMKYMPSGPINI